MKVILTIIAVVLIIALLYNYYPNQTTKAAEKISNTTLAVVDKAVDIYNQSQLSEANVSNNTVPVN